MFKNTQALRGFIFAVIVAFGIAASVPAEALTIGFNGLYDPAQWTTTRLGNPPLGATVISNTSLTITGGDSVAGCVGGNAGFLGPCEVDFTSKNPRAVFSFHWDYNTTDIGAGFDQFGVLVDGSRIVLSDLGGALHQSGDISFRALSQFGWFINCTDCTGGGATTTITNFVAATPEPGSLMLLGLGLVALAALRLHRA
jgi:hypothetical protein